jgi:hypothetical protein
MMSAPNIGSGLTARETVRMVGGLILALVAIVGLFGFAFPVLMYYLMEWWRYWGATGL